MAGFLRGYCDSLTSDASKRRHIDKLKLVDPYEVKKNEWKDDVDLWLHSKSIFRKGYVKLQEPWP